MQDVEPLLDRIYECSLIPGAWPATLEAVARHGGATGALLFTAGAGHSAWCTSASMDGVGQRYFNEGWAVSNMRTPKLLALRPSRFVHQAELFSDDQFDREPMQNELLIPLGFGREAAALTDVCSGERVVFSLHRPQSAGGFDRSNLARLDNLRPHLARAAALAARQKSRQCQSIAGVLDAIGLPAAILSEDGRVIATNPLLEHVSYVTSVASSRLILTNKNAQRELAESLLRLRNGRGPAQLQIRVSENGGPSSSVMLIIPLRGQVRDIGARAALIVIFVDLSGRSVPALAALQSVFGLTPSESRVAQGLMNHSVASLAAELSLSTETIRAHLKATMAKTGTIRQWQLAAKMTRLALAAPASQPGKTSRNDRRGT